MSAGGAERPPDVYTHGHHDSVLRSHRWRTAENSCGYLLEHLRPGQHLLDVGCGPGTITLDLARYVSPGVVVGLDAVAGVVDEAERNRAVAGVGNATFVQGDVYSLDAGDGTFDVVHAHQVLQHLADPVGALRQMRRVLRPGGLVAVRDSDYGAFVWAPADARLERWMALYHQVTARNGADADAGRRLPGWVRDAGFDDLTVTSSTWTFADADSRAWWAGLWAERVEHSAFAEQAIAYGLSEARELADIADAWRSWGSAPDGMFLVVHVEVVARR